MLVDQFLCNRLSLRRLRIRWERDPQQHLALLYLAATIIC